MTLMDEFIFDDLPVRGLLVQLTEAWTDVWTEVLQVLRRDADGPACDTHGPTVKNLLGQLTAAAVLLQGQTHIDGRVTMQIDGFGPLQRAIVEMGRNMRLRVMVKVNDPIIHPIPTFTLTLAPADVPPWQSTTPWTAPTNAMDTPLMPLSHVLQRHLLHSAQIETTWVLAADDKVAAGLLVWRWPPVDNGTDDVVHADDSHHEAYRRIAILASSLTPAELLTLDADTILRRLFWQEPWHRVTPPSG